MADPEQQSAAEEYRHSDDYPVPPCPGCGRPGRECRQGLYTCTQDPDACGVHTYEDDDV